MTLNLLHYISAGQTGFLPVQHRTRVKIRGVKIREREGQDGNDSGRGEISRAP